MDEMVMAPLTSVEVPGVQLGRSYNAFVTATNDGGQSNSSEVLTLSKCSVLTLLMLVHANMALMLYGVYRTVY